MELDMIENNGKCLGRTTWHVWGDKAGGCDQNGCFGEYKLDDACKFHMRTEFGEDGSLTQYRNGEIIPIGIAPRENNEIKSTMERVGSAIASTQWEGWVPDDGSCPPSGFNVTASEFAITNVVVNAPRMCLKSCDEAGALTFSPTLHAVLPCIMSEKEIVIPETEYLLSHPAFSAPVHHV